MVPLISDADARADAVAIAALAHQLHDEPVVRAGARVLPQFRGFAERRDHDVDLPIAVEVGKRTAPMCACNIESGPRVTRNIAKLSIPKVGEDAICLLVRRGFE